MLKIIRKIIKIAGYTILPFIISLIIQFLIGISKITDPVVLRSLTVVTSPLVFLLSYLIYNKNSSVANDFKFKKGDFKTVTILAIISLSINIGVGIIFKDKLERQDTLNILNNMNVYLAKITGIVLAPICEEYYFRKGFYNLFENKKLYIPIAGVLFGFVHYSPANSTITNLIMISTISIMGMIYCYFYSKEKRTGITIVSHMINNFIAMI